MARPTYASLLDDPRFLADLERIEVSGPAPIERPDSLWIAESAPPRRPSAPVRRAASAAMARRALGVAGFLVMMGVGGAAAVYVFADRVALILAR